MKTTERAGLSPYIYLVRTILFIAYIVVIKTELTPVFRGLKIQQARKRKGKKKNNSNKNNNNNNRRRRRRKERKEGRKEEEKEEEEEEKARVKK